ncbi:MAG: hypothetical protein E7585_01890 [Ruminococcaceae bacterium]|nr:hypothetical protein [Oscillospiraceae bacterium]
MTEFCWDCWRKMDKYHKPKWMYRYEWGICEECGDSAKHCLKEINNYISKKQKPHARGSCFLLEQATGIEQLVCH